ncbi:MULTISPECIES: alpha/beta hydrolase [Methylobacterium]|uniref:alpha/beta hydrolase n=1 Tax=Methylobacterium TaxID=407 RepID=UPI0013EBF74C|nr:alpha/beta hydrolase [Methylobacterium sp. DB0501]NGM36353.1 alpha/beta hydrolase [Methylobacterium sp. DB0501]
MIGRRVFSSGALAALAGAGLLKARSGQAEEGEEARPAAFTIQYATNRQKVGGTELFGREYEWGADDDRYHAGVLPVRVDGVRAAVASVPDGVGERDPRAVIREFLRPGGEAQGRGRRFAPPDSVLVFIHGFAFEFSEVLPVAVQLSRGYRPTSTLFFSWPSYGTYEKYKRDQPYAYGSGAAAAHFMRDLFDEYDKLHEPPAMSLACHSMGNRVLSAVVQHLKNDRPREKNYLAKRYFEHIFLFAADEDYRALNDPSKLDPILDLVRKTVNIYASGDDFALLLAEIVNDTPELGRTGPYSFPIRDGSGRKRDNLYWLNCQPVADPVSQTFGHQYFRLSAPVMNDVRQVLAGVDPRQIAGRCPAGFEGQKFDIRSDSCRS